MHRLDIYERKSVKSNARTPCKNYCIFPINPFEEAAQLYIVFFVGISTIATSYPGCRWGGLFKGAYRDVVYGCNTHQYIYGHMGFI